MGFDWLLTLDCRYAHTAPSYRYAYLLWFAITFFVLLFGTLGRLAGGDKKHGALSARWHKWSIRRPSLFALFRRMSSSLPRTNANMPPPPRKVRTPAWWKIKFSPSPVYGELLALFLLAAATALASILGPDYIKPSVSTFDLTHNNKRSLSGETYNSRNNDVLGRDYQINPVTPPGYTIQKAWWTAGGRTGTALQLHSPESG